MTGEPPAAAPPQAGSKTSGPAVASLICSIVGLCTCGLGGLVGLVLSIVALVKIRRSQGQLRGRGCAIAGLAVSALILVAAALMLVFRAELRDWFISIWEPNINYYPIEDPLNAPLSHLTIGSACFAQPFSRTCLDLVVRRRP